MVAATFVGFGTGYTGPTKILTDISLIKKDLMNQFMTMKGERLLDVNYGFIGHTLLFELMNDNIRTQLEDDAHRIIQSDPRVKEQSISITELNNGYQIDISLYYYTAGITDLLSLFFNNAS